MPTSSTARWSSTCADVPAPWPPDRDPGRPVVGFVGRIEPRKGPLDLVQAAPQIRAGLPGVRIVLVGDDPYDSAPEYAEQVRRAEGVEHVAWVADGAAVMRHLDVLVAPSRQEPFGTVLAEAKAAGTPVVATHVGGLAEVVVDGVTGRLVTPGGPTRSPRRCSRCSPRARGWAPPPASTPSASAPTPTPTVSRRSCSRRAGRHRISEAGAAAARR